MIHSTVIFGFALTPDRKSLGHYTVIKSTDKNNLIKTATIIVSTFLITAAAVKPFKCSTMMLYKCTGKRVEFAFSPSDCVGSYQVLRHSPLVQQNSQIFRT